MIFYEKDSGKSDSKENKKCDDDLEETEIVKIPNNFFGIWQHRLTIICRIPIETVAYF